MIARTSADEASDGSNGTLARRWPTSFRWLLVAIVAFAVGSFLLSWLRAVEFQTSTWDMGVYQQAIWTTSRGRAFYETADVETGGFGSLLQVHSVFLFYLIVPLYALLPYQTTLFAVQSSAVAVAAIPAYLLSRRLTSSSGAALAVGVLYLAWTPTLSSTLYDFHPEAFLPVELFTLALFWEEERYRWAFVVAAVAFATMEVAPVLTFFVGVFGLLTVRAPSQAVPAAVVGLANRSPLSTRLGLWLRERRVRASGALMVVSVLAYALLLYLRTDVLTGVLGTYPLPVAAAGYVIGASPAALQLSLSYVGLGLPQKLTYWLLVLGLLGFAPLFAPRALVLSAPWFTFTLLSADTNYATLGFQYGFIVACSLVVALPYGLPTAKRFARGVAGKVATMAPVLRFPRVVPLWRTHRKVILAGGFASLLALNLALTPLNPYLDNAAGLGSAYHISYAPPATDAEVQQLVEMIPSGATVLVSDDLFPLLANDPNAYSFLWAQDPGLYLPFNVTRLPAFVLVSQEKVSALPPWVAGAISNRTLFGVRAVVWATSAGEVVLYEASYSGTVTEFGAPPPSTSSYLPTGGPAIFGNSPRVASTPVGGSRGLALTSTSTRT
jgi:uncharacterized membrane protein